MLRFFLWINQLLQKWPKPWFYCVFSIGTTSYCLWCLERNKKVTSCCVFFIESIQNYKIGPKYWFYYVFSIGPTTACLSCHEDVPNSWVLCIIVIVLSHQDMYKPWNCRKFMFLSYKIHESLFEENHGRTLDKTNFGWYFSRWDRKVRVCYFSWYLQLLRYG